MVNKEKFLNLLQEYNNRYSGRKNGDIQVVPLCKITGTTGIFGDGTCNLAKAMSFHLASSDNDAVSADLNTIDSLIFTEYYRYSHAFPQYIFVKESGFFSRNLPNPQIDNYEGITQFDTYLETVDTCYSPFISQDQVWHLIPILIRTQYGCDIARDIMNFIISNNHIIYNPYLSQLIHYNTYTGKLKEPLANRLPKMMATLRNTHRVKRGADNRIFANLFQKVYKSLGGKVPFWKALPYCWQPLFFELAHLLWFPLVNKFSKSWDREYPLYSMNIAADSSKWKRRYIKRFAKELREKGEIFMSDMLIYFTPSKFDNDIIELMESWFNNTVPSDGESPITHLQVYSFLPK